MFSRRTEDDNAGLVVVGANDAVGAIDSKCTAVTEITRLASDEMDFIISRTILFASARKK